jgi:hypothetical protein
MKEYNGRKSKNQERMLYRRMKEADEAIEAAEDMMEDEGEYGDMKCEKRKCEMGKRKSCK